MEADSSRIGELIFTLNTDWMMKEQLNVKPIIFITVDKTEIRIDSLTEYNF